MDKQKAFMELYQPLHTRLSRYAQSLTRNNEDAKDLMSETLLVAFEKFETLQKPESFLYFLFSIASKLYKHKLRRKKWWGIFDMERAEAIAEPGGGAELSAEVAMLYAALDRLPLKYREALVLFELSGFSIKEITEIQGGSESGVKSRLTRGREKLAEVLGVKREAQMANPVSLMNALNTTL